MFIFKRKAAVLENSREQDSDKSKMGRYERKLRRESLVSEQKAMVNLYIFPFISFADVLVGVVLQNVRF